MSEKQTYIALLRGINVGGHHKVPMADLRKLMEKTGFQNVKTLLNSGNVIFDVAIKPKAQLETEITQLLEKEFGFPIPVLIRTAADITALIKTDPFKNVAVTKDIRLYVSFLKKASEKALELPWISADNSFRIIDVQNKTVCSVLDISVTKTPKGMEMLEQFFGKDITTRNWKTVNRIIDKITAS